MIGIDKTSMDVYPIHINTLAQYNTHIGLPDLIRAGVKNNFDELIRFKRVKELAGKHGFEPRSSELEADVLPLNYSPAIKL